MNNYLFKLAIILFIILLPCFKVFNSTTNKLILEKEEIQNLNDMSYQEGVTFIKSMEGCRKERYNCAAGIPTIGWGITDKKIVNQENLTIKQLDSIFKLRICKDFTNIRNKYPNLQSSKVWCIVSCKYNYSLASFKKLEKYIEKGNFADKITEYVYGSNGKKLEGLIVRTNHISNLWRNSNYIKENYHHFHSIVVKQYKLNGVKLD